MDAWRSLVLAEAETWLRTPWAHNQCVKGAGVDCGRFLHAVYHNAGLVANADFGEYAADWMMHQSEERYLGWIERFADPVDAPLPADLVLWRFGQCFSHGAIVLDWPLVIHSYRPEKGVCYGDATKGILAREHLADGGSAPRVTRFFSTAKRV